ncbi:MAG: site-specific DNA-methyltransferase [Chloroflexi bacterium]|nr:site-specific DNA-methyltransferase [Chloroflexota bacterium]
MNTNPSTSLRTGVLYYSDNLDILRDHIPGESVDLIYLDPPFNSNRSYNVLFRESSGSASEAQIEAFEDTWEWGDAARDAYHEVVIGPHQQVARMLGAIVEGLGHNPVTAYLTMMSVRLVELHRVLKPTGSIYLHCDPTAGPYLRVLMDSVFEPRNFVNEVVWKRTSSHNDPRRFGRIHDTLLVYQKTPNRIFNISRRELDPSYVGKVYTRVDDNGRRYRLDNISAPGGRGPVYEWHGVTRPWRYTKENMEALYAAGRIRTYPDGRPMINAYVRYLDESEGQPLQDWWDDIGVIAAPAKERLGYPTQKPLALLERIINASSNEGDIVLDSFCGCGTAIHAAHKLGRRWIGIDVTHLAIGLIRRRMQDAFPGITIHVEGDPKDLAGAQELAATKPRQFEYWAVDRLNARPTGGKGPDLDGVKPFIEFGGRAKRAVISVKGTRAVNPEMIREVLGAMSEAKPIGVLVLLTPPTSGMKTAAAAAGFYESSAQKYPRVQIITVSELFAGKQIEVPGPMSPFAQAPLERETATQGILTEQGAQS